MKSASSHKITITLLLLAAALYPSLARTDAGIPARCKAGDNSLTIKGHELDIDLDVLLKTISQKKIETMFIKLVHHPVFSYDYQLQIFKEYIKKFNQVKAFEASCLSPIKLFFQEFYALQLNATELLFEFMQRLQTNNYLDNVQSLNFTLPLNYIELPFYKSRTGAAVL